MFHSVPRDSILSVWAQSPIIPITTHLLSCVPSPAHPPICLPLWQLQTPSVHPSDNSVRTPSIFSFFGQTFRTPTCVCPSPMDNILSDWARSPFIPTTTHLSFCLSTWLPTLPTLSRLPPNPPTSTFNCPQLHLDSDHIRLPFLSGLCGLICPSHNSIHPAIHQIHLGLPIHPHPHSTVHNSIWTRAISIYHFCLGSLPLSVHPTTPSGLCAPPFTCVPFFDTPPDF